LAALETQLTEAQQKASQWDQLRAMAEQRQREQAEEAQRTAWQQRIDALVDLTPEQAAVERTRLIGEIEAAQRSRYEPQVAERESAAEEAAKAFAAFYTTAQHTLTPEQFQALTEQSKFLLQFNSPDAMTAQVAREKAIRDAAFAAAKAEFEKQQETALATAAQTRMQSPADLVGAGATGSPATAHTGDALDELLDSVFVRR
jgi:membrane protein involved in colicin uptake